MATICKWLELGANYDYNLFIPADEYRSLTPTPSVSSAGSEKSEVEEPKEYDLANTFAEKVDTKDLNSRFRALSGGGNTIATNKAAELARSLGLAPSKEDEIRLEKEVGLQVTLNQLQDWLISVTHPEDNIDSIKKFFQRFDRAGTGKLPRLTLIHILTQMGDALTRQEADKLLSDLGISGDPVDYAQVIEK